MPVRVIKVYCQCGQLLFRYDKGGKGRLIKCFLSKIIDDEVSLVGRKNGEIPLCPACGKSLGIICLIHGKPALKINHGTVKDIRL